jgi:hypothetical protein
MSRLLTDPKELTKLVSFLVMGDGGVHMTGRNAYFVMTQREDHLDFIEYAQVILANVTGTRISYVDRSGDSLRNQWRLSSRTHPTFTRLRERIYTAEHYKGLDPHALKLLDWEAAAILYMGDGSFVERRRKVTLNLKRLSYGDQVLLKRALEEKRMGAWNIHRQNQYTYLSLATRHQDLFLEGVAPYVVPSYQYKLGRLAPAPVG